MQYIHKVNECVNNNNNKNNAQIYYTHDRQTLTYISTHFIYKCCMFNIFFRFIYLLCTYIFYLHNTQYMFSFKANAVFFLILQTLIFAFSFILLYDVQCSHTFAIIQFLIPVLLQQWMYVCCTCVQCVAIHNTNIPSGFYSTKMF